MAKNNDNRNRFLSALITLLLGAGILALLFFTSLHYEYPPKDAKLQDLLQDTIIFGGELVELGDLPELDNSQDLIEHHGLACLGAQLLHVNKLTFRNGILLATGFDDCLHVLCTCLYYRLALEAAPEKGRNLPYLFNAA